MAFQTKGAQFTQELARKLGDMFALQDNPEMFMGKKRPMSQEEQNYEMYNSGGALDRMQPQEQVITPDRPTGNSFVDRLVGWEKPLGPATGGMASERPTPIRNIASEGRGILPEATREKIFKTAIKKKVQEAGIDPESLFDPAIIASAKKGGLNPGDYNAKGEIDPSLYAEKSNISRSPGGYSPENMPIPEEAPREMTSSLAPKEGGGIFGGLGKFFTDPENLRVIAKGIDRQAELADPGIAKYGIGPTKLGTSDQLEKTFRKMAFKDSANPDGTINKNKLIGELNKYGFNDEALKLQDAKEKLEAPLVKKFLDIAEKKKSEDEKKVNNQLLLEDARKRGLKVVQDGKGGVTVTEDPNARLNSIANIERINEQIKIRNLKEGTNSPLIKIPSPGGQEVGRGPSSFSGRGPASFGGSRGPSVIDKSIPGQIQSGMPVGVFGQNLNPGGLRLGTRRQDEDFKYERNKLDKEQSKFPSEKIQLQKDSYKQALDVFGNLEQTPDGDVTFKSKTGTGQYRSQLENLMQSPAYQEAKAAIGNISIGSLPEGMSQLFNSTFERELAESRNPQLKNDPRVNYNLSMRGLEVAQGREKYRDAKNAYLDEFKTTKGFDRVWNQYKDSNPSLLRTDKGLLVENPTDVPWEEYYKQAQTGARPLPVDWKNLNSKYSARKNPIVQDPGIEAKIDENSMYILPGGSVSGKDLKMMIAKEKAKR